MREKKMKTPETSKHFKRVTDPKTGVAHHVLTTKLAKYQQGFYFVNNSMTRDGRYLWFYATPAPIYDTMSRNMGYVDFLTDEVVICYDVLFDDATPFVDPDTGDVYYTYKKGIYKREPKKDATAVKLCTVNIQGHINKLATHLTRCSDKSRFFLDINRGDFGCIQGTVNIETGEFTEWSRAPLGVNMNHGQINPRNDRLALCAYDGWSSLESGENHRIPYDENGFYQRLWTLTADGGRKMHPAMHNYATHEWWSGDGKKIYYCCDGYGIYGIELETGEDITILEGVDPWHAHSTNDDMYFVYDEKKLERYGGKWYRGCPAALNFLNRKTGKHLVVVSEMPENGFTPENQTAYHIDPHPRFTENEKYIVFTTSELGGADLAIASVEELIKLTS